MRRIVKTLNSVSKKFGYKLTKMKDFNFKENFPEALKFEKNLLYACSKYSMTGRLIIKN